MSTVSTDSSHAQRIIADCTTAYSYAYQTAIYGTHNDLLSNEIVRACFDAADLCLAYANALTRGSQHVDALGDLACRVADALVDALGPIEHDNALLRTTYAACARACQAMRAQAGDTDAAKTYTMVDEAVDETFPASDPPSFNPQSI